MESSLVSKTWVRSGLEDLYFGFCIEYEPHRPYALFSDIMGLEKLLKAYLLHLNSEKYSHLDIKGSKKIIECLVKKWGHSIKRMIKEINKIEQGKYDCYKGSELITVIEAGYMESRYPVSRPIYEQFKIKGTDMYWDRLGSSAITDLIYHLSRSILLSLSSEVALEKVGQEFMETHGSRESFGRFTNIFFKGEVKKYLLNP